MMRILVTGGGGFLGKAITRQLLDKGYAVRVLGRNRYPEVEEMGAEGVVCDLSVGRRLDEALVGVDAVIHTAARAGMWGAYEDYYQANVVATERLLEAIQRAAVPRLVYTSSPSVTFQGRDEENVSENDARYPDTFPFYYPETKALAEAIVLAANGPALATTSIRPHLIYGPGDPHLLPRLVARHQAGRLRVIGDGKNKVALTYIDNAAQAHVQALEQLAPDSPNAGKPYFVTDEDPVLVWDWLNEVFQEAGLGRIEGQVSRWIALPLASAVEGFWWALALKSEPPITKFTVQQISSSHWYDLSNAKRDFGYAPSISGEEGKLRTIAWLKEAHPPPPPPPPEPAPAPKAAADADVDNPGSAP
ncbi:MAG: NAD-dependent epimerase/dehydratase family protein [Myxococcota bacterium]